MGSPGEEDQASGMESANQEVDTLEENNTPKKSHVNDYDKIKVIDEEANESTSM